MVEPEKSSDCWYEVVEGSQLEQGDILRSYPVAMVYIARSADGKPDVRVMQRDVIVLTQTCDIPKKSQTSILVAQVVDYNALCHASAPDVSGEKYRNKLIENAVIAMFLLHEHEIELPFPWSIVSFRDLYVSPKDDARMFAQSLGPRLRLRSPYKEHLSQSFARFMMRVGLPNTTHRFASCKPEKVVTAPPV